MNNGKLIAIWGSGGSGKTTTAVKLAARLAEEKKEVMLVLTDITSPDLNVLLPFKKDAQSMGHIWALPNCSVDAILKASVTTESKYIGILGYGTGENVFSFPEYTKANIMEIYLKLKGMADYVIVDCVSEFAYNVLTTVALEMADKVIRLGEATIKSFSFFDSNLSLLLDSRYKTEQHIKVISKEKSYQVRETALSHYGGAHAVLPFVPELENQMLEGRLFSLSSGQELKEYRNGLEILFRIILEETVEGGEAVSITKAQEKKSSGLFNNWMKSGKRERPPAGKEKDKTPKTARKRQKEESKVKGFKLRKKGEV